jgi:hemolysin III
MKTAGGVPRYRVGEEIASCLIHAVGVVLATAGAVVLTVSAYKHGTVWHVVGCSVFAVTLILLYTISTLYHGIRFPRAKGILRILDHSAIFLLIAGTYTPFTLVNLRGAWGWSLLGTIWGLAILGILFKVTMRDRWPIASVVFYLFMGWLIVIAAKPLLSTVAPGGLLLLVGGGLAYTLGVVFYAWRRLPYHHAIWHAFVITGSTAHFFAVLFYVVLNQG